MSQDCAARQVSYLKSIKPLLKTKCYACHGALKQEGSLRLETRSVMLKGGDSGPALVPKDVAGSLILQRITAHPDERMPPVGEGSALNAKQIELIRRWISQGADAPDEELPESPTDHWAFRTIQAPAAGRPQTIDACLQQQRDEHGITTQPLATRSIRLRRLYLDLVGLPPTLEQLRDQRPWPEIVDELLASPHYGERWGRHWMDVWRYSDWYGLGAQLRNSQKHLWHWRDWIVNSLNEDKGYDRMIMEMLAGDELAPDDTDVVAGTGFLARNYYLFNRTTWLDSTIEHTGKAFLGLTLNCAKCHDHKYDPISQVDYYNFRAIFEPHQVRLDPVPGTTDFEKDGLPRVFDDHPDAETWLHRKGNPKDPDKDTEIAAAVPAIFAAFQHKAEQISLPPSAWVPSLRDFVQKDYLNSADTAIASAEKEVAEARRQLETASEKQHKTGKQTEPADFVFKDSFDHPNPDVWNIVGESWEYADGVLRRTTATREREFVRLKQPLPRDFELTCRYTTTGGTTYKSVTFRFDQSIDGKYDNFVYTSAHAPGPKVQAAYTRDGSTSYPVNGRVARPITVGETYELRFAVRDQLVNVWLNDEFVLAHLYPDRQPDGSLSLSGFDATVSFDSIAIRSLPADFPMKDAGNKPPASSQDPKVALKIAEAKLLSARARRDALGAVFAADRARYLPQNAKQFEDLKKAAAVLQARELHAQADYELLAAGADLKKAEAAKKKLNEANQKLEAAEKGDGAYVSVRASRKALETPAHKEADYAPVYSSISTGRRLALARWVTSPQNPLTARVAVNHIWMRHFGEPLVESVFDFGLRAPRPVHAQLLDLLAWEFMQSGWSMKHLHRLIVTSEAWQLSSSTKNAAPETQAADSNNRFYWRMNTRRMEAQVVRDSLLKLSGTLDTTPGGPSLNTGNGSSRRSLYYKHSRDQRDKFLSMFDDADLLQCYRRDESIVPQQALALANSELPLTKAVAIAKEIDAATISNDTREFVETAFELLLGRLPEAQETTACLEFCEQVRPLLSSDGKKDSPELRRNVHTRLVHSLLNHNDFVSIR